MKTNRVAGAVLVAALVGAGATSSVVAQNENTTGQAQVIVTVNANKSLAGRPSRV